MNRVFLKHKITRVIHLAGLPGIRYSVKNPRDYFDINVNGTANLLELCRLHSVSQFVLASSSSVYGKAKFFPTRETDSTEIPLSPYAASKKMGKDWAKSFF
jgi:UDP-glucuronate 4-epimerase